MRRPTRPAHHELSPLEMAVFADDATAQRISARGFLLLLIAAFSPAAVPLAICALATWGGW